jgi:hypothetical protein
MIRIDSASWPPDTTHGTVPSSASGRSGSSSLPLTASRSAWSTSLAVTFMSAAYTGEGPRCTPCAAPDGSPSKPRSSFNPADGNTAPCHLGGKRSHVCAMRRSAYCRSVARPGGARRAPSPRPREPSPRPLGPPKGGGPPAPTPWRPARRATKTTARETVPENPNA